MFKKSRRKIVAAIMSVLVVLWVGTLGVIYTSSYFEMKKQNEEILKAHAQMYNLPKVIDQMKPPSKPHGGNHRFDKGFAETPRFQLSTFYSVAVSYEGEVLDVKNEQSEVHSDDKLKALALEIIKSTDETGAEDNLAYYKTDKGSYTLVTFMDNTLLNESAWTLFRYTLIFGGAALAVFFLLSVFLARKIVNPLEESYEKQKQFISDAGHELKTPVSVVNANAELLSREIGENQWLQNIQYENERMGLLVGQLLSLARAEKVALQKEHIDFSRLVAGEALPFESVVFEKGLNLSTNISPDITVEGESSQLKQVVSILLDNAVCHSEDKGEIHLSLIKDHGFAKLSVINKGEEIPKEQREQIFQRFYRADTARSGEDKHYGLGLAIAKAIVLSHKGHIEVLCYDGLVEFRVKLAAV
ncbi:MAG: HAMP domain-containing histidine kinase [Clostridia bacterium]|nr:HAMP domain-containing histidine kinase [Clostridia bacterium]